EFVHGLPFAGLPFSEFEFTGDRMIRFAVPRQPAGLVDPATASVLDPDAATWLVDLDLDSYAVSRVPPAEVQRRRRAAPRNIRKGFMASDPGPYEIPSPDGSLLLGEQGPNLAVRGVVDDKPHLLTHDGVEGRPWQVDAVVWWSKGAVWSSDSQRVAVT